MYQPIQLKTKITSLRNSISRSLVAIFTVLLAAMASVQSVQAIAITVMNTNDSGTGSLRQALADANDGDTIDFSVTGTITLGGTNLAVDKNLTINGPGADQLAVDANHNSRVFLIGSGKTVTISGLTITNGSHSIGGGILNNGATLISNSTLRDNSASGAGGGIYNFGNATLRISNSTLRDNSASGGSVNNGGGIFNNSSATLTITNSTISGNSAIGSGGGIRNDGSATISNSTISGNSAGFHGGGIFNSGGATLMISNSILNTSGASGSNIFNNFGTVTSLGYNLSSDAAGGDGNTGPGGFLNATGDIRNTDPMLGSLADNGGPTFTHALLTGSPAIDMGDPNFDPNDFDPPMIYDQRGPGFPRVVNGRIDIGAFEVQASPSVCPQPQGYWKNNPDAWPVEELMLGNENYTKTELLNILNMPIGTGKNADASLILADQLIAAKLNIANGADDPDPVPATITDADAVLSLYPGKLPYGVRTNSTNGQRMVNDRATLESYNKGFLTPGCTQ
jgi:hypothetical protein